MKAAVWLVPVVAALVAACGDGTSATDTPDAGKALADYLPAVPAADGTARTTFAAPITAAADLIPGPAAVGLVGDVAMRNSKLRLVIQAPGRAIGLVPFGGNIVDAVPLGADGKDLAPDHFGELSLVYLIGRTCNHKKIEILRDGSGGGAAVVRATGTSAINDYVNLKGLAVLPIPPAIDPDLEDSVTCATTYTLAPGSDTVEVAWTLFNGGNAAVNGPLGMLNDAGGSVQIFTPRFGFSHLGGSLSSLTGGGDVSVPYQVYQGPGVAYGLVPHTDGEQQSAGVIVSGAAILIFDATTFLDILTREKDSLHLTPGGGVTRSLSFVVGRDGNIAEVALRKLKGQAMVAVSGTAAFSPSGTAARARVTVYADANGNSLLDDTDPVRTYFEARADGTFDGALLPGTYLVRADVPGVSRSAVKAVTVAAAAVNLGTLSLPEPARIDYAVVDDADGRAGVPVKLTVVGRSPIAGDARFEQTNESRFGIVRTLFAPHGTSTGDPGDAPLLLPAGGPYRIFVSRGPEWSVFSTVVTPTAGQQVTLPQIRLRRVLDTSGYVATAFHEHAVGSPDSPVPFETRLASLVVEGIELFAGTDHDNISDYAPLIDAAGLRGVIESVIGIETTPFAFGHFNAYPMDYDPDDPSHGAVDWGQGSKQGFGMLPGEIFDDMRKRGAKVVQVCHPRSAGISTFQGYFWRSGLVFDFVARTFRGDPLVQDVPNDWLRLPAEKSLFAETFNALEMWNGFGRSDSDGDGLPEFTNLDLVTRDWMNFLSMGKIIAPVGNGDTHVETRDAAGLPRSLIRVTDDTEGSLDEGLADEVWATMNGQTVRDLVVTNGPMIRVSEPGEGKPSLIGRVVEPSGGTVTLALTASAANLATLDTIEVYANNTFDRFIPGKGSSLQPFACFTSRQNLGPKDPCGKAPLGGARPLVTTEADAGGGFTRHEVRATITLRASDIPVRAGATGTDAWLVVRVRGSGSTFPIIPDDSVTSDNVDILVAGDPEATATALRGRGAFPLAFTAPIFLDFDGGGYRAPFQP